MMRLNFTITFHGPFRVGTGAAFAGVDDAVSPDDPLPASSLKGLMRASLTELGATSSIVNAVFGKAGSSSPWSWTRGQFEDQPRVQSVTRVARHEDTFTALPDYLSVIEVCWVGTATFSVLLRDGLRLRDSEPERHAAVLTAAAHGVHALGADRRRGLGWVTIKRVEADPDWLAAFEDVLHKEAV